jgi:hypothetical protein
MGVPFRPLRAPDAAPVSGGLLNRVQDLIASALKSVAAGGVTKLTSRDKTVVLAPPVGTGAVDLSVTPPGVLTPGAVSVSLGNAPTGTTGGSTADWLDFVVGGVHYRVPAWLVAAPIPGFPSTGLQQWLKGDAGLAASGSPARVTTWSDQSGNGYDVVPNTLGPLVGAIGSVSAANFTRIDDSALHNGSLPWNPSWSMLVVFQSQASGLLGRLVDWHYSNDNKCVFLSGSNLDGAHGESWFSTVIPLTINTTYSLLITFDAGIACNAYLDDMVTPFYTGTAAHTMASGMRLGSVGTGVGQGTDSLIAEFAIWDHPLDSSERSQVQAYVTAKY